MPINEGLMDRVLRIVVGLGILSLAFWGLETQWAFIGLVPIMTGIFGYCPFYTLFGITTCPMKPSKGPR